MAGEYQDKVALVTGGGSGIGAAIARELAAGGARVVVADLNIGHAQAVADEIAGKGGTAAVHEIDVTDAAAVEAMVAFTEQQFGGLDWAVNNAGIGGEANLVGDYSIEGWHKVISVNLGSVFYCTRYEIAAMLRRGGGSIVNMASILGTNGFATAAAYVAAKHGVVGLTKTAAVEYSARGIRVNAVGPAFINTPLIDKGLDDATRKMLVERHPIGRLGEPEEVAALTAFLLSDRASFITGSYHLVDGAYSAQ